ncbi:MAG TPA: cytochrome P460 family protein [Pyrinomonadaceae bacterium]|nr:cytochrome P460 family protein [Pyrinomonadaceae bacterium]
MEKSKTPSSKYQDRFLRFPANILILSLTLVLGGSAFAQKNASTNNVTATPVQTSPCANGRESGLPLPSRFLPAKLPEFQMELKSFLTSGKYKTLNWCADKQLRDTGPFINTVSYGTHPTVKVYYSPAVINWLLHRETAIPDGSMIVKEQYTAPAARYQLGPPKKINGWTIMIKDSKGSADGWYWAELWDAQCMDNNNPPFAVPYAGFGLYCVRCHASAEKEHTFTYSKNINGFPGDPDSYFIDLSWTSDTGSAHGTTSAQPCGEPAESDRDIPTAGHNPDATDVQEQALFRELATLRAATLNPQFAAFYSSIAPVPQDKVKKFPGETYDHIFPQNIGAVESKPAPSPNPNQFLTSDQCMGCHSAGTYGKIMMYTGSKQPDNSTPVMNVSPFGEWRWSPMGLAGRDPIFYAQLDSEIAFVKSFFKNDPAKVAEKIRDINNTCFKCHGVMGKRRLDDDHGGPDKGNFEGDLVYATYDSKAPGKDYIYGALARDGVSCMACHRIIEDKPSKGDPDPLTSFLKNNITGNFTTGSPADLFGPFEDKEIVTDPMNNSLGIKPKHDGYIKKSRLCGNCHTINLPLMDNPTTDPNTPHLEQLTYLEWLNSGYQNEVGTNSKAQTCQECHMATKYVNSNGTLNIPLIQQPIAFIEDDQYPQTGNRLPDEKIKVRFRDKGFVRHQLQGLNVTLAEMFRQFMSPYNSNGNPNVLANPILGVRQNDYMSGLDDLATAIDAFVEQAQSSTAEVSVSPPAITKEKLIADVKVTNKTGHRFPSGVGFRRAYLEFRVIDNDTGNTVWCSGCTNELGVIMKNAAANSERLPSELFDVYKDGSKPANHGYPAGCDNNFLPGINPQYYQPHFFWDPQKNSGSAITRQDQVQIYEELNLNNQCAMTTSFLRRDFQLKDNRILPFGWTSTGPLKADKTPYIPADYLHETYPVSVGGDPAYADGSGTSVVRYEVPLSAFTPRKLSVTATLYYQSIPPYFLHDRFSQAPNEPATQRLYYLTSNLQTKGTAIEGWKLQIAKASQ